MPHWTAGPATSRATGHWGGPSIPEIALSGLLWGSHRCFWNQSPIWEQLGRCPVLLSGHPLWLSAPSSQAAIATCNGPYKWLVFCTTVHSPSSQRGRWGRKHKSSSRVLPQGTLTLETCSIVSLLAVESPSLCQEGMDLAYPVQKQNVLEILQKKIEAEALGRR